MILKISNLHKIYDPAENLSQRVAALQDISLDVQKGEFLSIIGPSGCGKSTLFEMIGGLVSPTQGEIYIDGELVQGPHPAIGMVFQEDSTFPWRTVLENVEFGLEMKGIPKKERREICQEMIHLVGLSGFENRYPPELSGGMRQRVAIARTLVLNPKIILMDEPFGALDEQTRLILGEELLKIWEETGATILFVTHSITESVQLSDRILVMTARPGTIKKIMRDDLERPRTALVIASLRFTQLVNEIWEALREEALKGLRPGRE
jgi:NitT/TauT family transport system ATP-binding protein